MAFEDLEYSSDSGEIIEFYEFSTLAEVWRYCTFSRTITTGVGIFQPLLIQREKIERSKNLLKSDLEINIPRTADFAKTIINMALEQVVVVSVWQAHLSNPESMRLVWKGRYTNYDIEDSMVGLVFEPISSTMKRLGFRAKYQRICRHLLYGSSCGASTATQIVSGKVTSIIKDKITVSEVGSKLDADGEEIGYSDGYFTAGFIVTKDNEKRMITSHKGVNLVLLRPLETLRVGDEITAYAGCDHTFNTCRDKFSNKENYGGFDFIPYKNPYNGSKVF